MKWGILGALDAEVDLIRNKMTITSETPLFGMKAQSVRSKLFLSAAALAR